MKFTIYKDNSRWFWRLVSEQGVTMAQSSAKGFGTPRKARDNIDWVKGCTHADVETHDRDPKALAKGMKTARVLAWRANNERNNRDQTGMD